MEKEEVWKSIEGYEGFYEVSSFGRIRSLDRKVMRGGHEMSRRGQIVGTNVSAHGYGRVVLCLNGVETGFQVHQVVAMAFLGHVPNFFEKVINHIDGDKLNNHIDNLEVVTNRENTSTCHRKNEGTYSSIYVGVSWCSVSNKWVASIYIHGFNIHLGSFENELDASNAYQEALVNKDNSEYFKNIKDRFASKHKYIYFSKSKNRWEAIWMVNKKRVYIGSYLTELLAYTAQQAYIKEHNLENIQL